MKKKFLSTLLAVAMILTLLPVGAFAAETPVALTNENVTLSATNGVLVDSKAALPTVEVAVESVAENTNYTVTWTGPDDATTEVNDEFSAAGTYKAKVAANEGDSVVSGEVTLTYTVSGTALDLGATDIASLSEPTAELTDGGSVALPTVIVDVLGAGLNTDYTVAWTKKDETAEIKDTTVSEAGGYTATVTAESSSKLVTNSATLTFTVTAKQKPEKTELSAENTKLSETTAELTGSTVDLPTVTVTVNGTAVEETGNYAVKWTKQGDTTEITEGTVSEAGAYTATVTAEETSEVLSGSVTLTFTVTSKDEPGKTALSAENTTLSATTAELTGATVNLPTVTVTVNEETVEATGNYTVKWTKQGDTTEITEGTVSEAGAYTATVIAEETSEVLSGSVTLTFTVTSKDEPGKTALSAENTKLSETTAELTGATVNLPTVTVTVNEETVEATGNYTVKWTKQGDTTEITDTTVSEAGAYTATVTAEETSEVLSGSVTLTFTVTSKDEPGKTALSAENTKLSETTAELTGATVDLPTVTVTVDGTAVEKTGNYAVKWTKQGDTTEITDTTVSEAGAYTATVTAEETSEVLSGSVTLTFTVTSKDEPGKTALSAENTTLSATTAVLTDGSATLPSVTVDVAGAVKDTDYTVAWTNASGDAVTGTTVDAAGTYTATVAAKSTSTLVSGKVTLTFEVTEEKLVGDVAITLVPEGGIKLGDTLPNASTTNNNVTLTTVWKKGSEAVTKAETAGDYTATITVTAKDGFELKQINYTLDGKPVTADVTTATITKTITVEAPAAKKYSIQIADISTGGSAVAQVNGVKATEAAEKDQVTIVPAPKDGFKLAEIVVNGVTVPSDEIIDGNYTFSMPAANVTVMVSFVAVDTVNVTVEAPAATAGKTDVPENSIDAAIEAAKNKDNIPEGTDAKVGNVAITAKDASEVTLSENAVKKLADAETESVTVKAKDGEVTLPKEVLAKVENKPMTLVVEKVANPDVSAGVVVKHSVEVTVKSDGKEVPVSGLATPIKLKFTVDKNLTGKPILAYFHEATKTLRKIASSLYHPETGVIEGEITHLTTIVVADEKDVEEEPTVTTVGAVYTPASGLTTAENQKFYGGKLTLTGLDTSKTYIVCLDNGLAEPEYQEVEVNGKKVKIQVYARICTVVKPTSDTAEISCQSTGNVMVIEVGGDGNVNNSANWNIVVKGDKTNTGKPVTAFQK